MSTQETEPTVRKGADEIEENALRLEEERARQVIDALNTDLASTYVAYHQIRKHHWNVEGAEFRDIHVYLGEVAEDLEEAADEFAERAQALGGAPLSGGATYEEHATVEPEGEDVYDIRTSLANDMEMFGDMIESMRDHIQLMENLGDYTSSEIIRRNLETVEEHAHHFQHYLEDDTLVFEGSVRE